MTPSENLNFQRILQFENEVLHVQTYYELQVNQLVDVEAQVKEYKHDIEEEMLAYEEKKRLEMQFIISDDLHILSLLHGRYEKLLRKCKKIKRKWRRILQQQVKKKTNISYNQII